METPVQFKSGDETLCGILHLPESARRPEFGFVFAHSGSRGRRGNTFQYPRYARHLAAQGYPCLRFDPAGVADSSGDIETTVVDDFYGSIQLGRYVNDTVAGVEEFLRHVRPRRLILFGICGGGITALLTAPQLNSICKVDGIVLMSIPVIIDSSQQDEIARIPKEYARKYLLSVYAKKIFSPISWWRLLSRKSDSYIWTMLRASFFGAGDGASAADENDTEDGPRFNRLFLQSLEEMVDRKARVLFLFGEDDTFRWEFQRKFYDVHWQKDPRYQRRCEVHYIAGCNHMFTMREWQQQALDFVDPWLREF